MKAVTTLILLGSFSIWFTACAGTQEWITILVHGSIGVGANLCGRTISLIKKDCIEGSSYERSVLKMRQHPYINTLHPLGPLGLHPVPQDDPNVNGAVIFSELYTAMAAHFGSAEKNTFYTFGWSGLISTKARQQAARIFYQELSLLIKEKKKTGAPFKIRVIGYSHGGTMLLNFARLRATEFCHDTFCIDETILVGIPVNKAISQAINCAPFQRVYNLYSLADKVQRLDVFTSTYVLSERTFSGKESPLLTQIEFRYTAALRPLPHKVLPSSMRGIITQSPGHVEWWSFGWVNSMYRKNLDMYPLSGAVFIPFLLYASKKLPRNHIQVDLRPAQEQAYVQSRCDGCTICVPFMTQEAYQLFLDKAHFMHPYYSDKREQFLKLESSLEMQPYQYAS